MKIKWIVPVVLPLAAVAAVVVPLVVDQPFGTQTPRTLQLAYVLRRWSPALTAVLLITAMVLAVRHARYSRWYAKAGWVLSTAVIACAAWFAWQNPFEWMFNPLEKPRFVSVRDASFVEPGDLVLAVAREGEVAAYPIRQLAYHHLVNDRIGRTPAVVTY